jgi:DNA modification methylase
MIASHKKNIADILGRESVHPFPARMAPGIALDIVGKRKNKSITVLDPMSGSGTVLALARAAGHHAVGVDIDPLAVLIARVWTSAIDPSDIRAAGEVILGKARRRFRSLSTGRAYPAGADEATREFIRYWFDPYARRQLACLAHEIAEVKPKVHREALWCAFSRLIITKQSGASLAMDLAHSRPHKSYDVAPAKPFRKFMSAVERVAVNCIDSRDGNRGPAARVMKADARRLPFESGSIDLVLTSPPYLNAIDYMRCSKFSLVWMGYKVDDLRETRAESVGSEVGAGKHNMDEDVSRVIAKLGLGKRFAERDRAVLARYVADMRKAVAEVARVLKPSGQAVYVVGENTVRGTYIRTARLVEAVAKLSGLELVEKRSRALPANRRYLPPPVHRGRSLLNARMRREVVLALRHRRLGG